MDWSFKAGDVCLKSFKDDLRGGRFISDSRIEIPSMYTETSRFATVVAMGEPVWVPGEWWYREKFTATGPSKDYLRIGSDDWPEDGWEWVEGYYERPEVKVGDVVMCNRYPKSARPIIINAEEFVIVKEEEILARVNA